MPRLAYITDKGSAPEEYYRRVLKKMKHPRDGQPVTWEWVLDFYHVCGYLGKMADALFGSETTAGAQIGPAHDEKVKRVEGSGRNRSSGKGGDEEWESGVHSDSGDDAGQPGETAAYLPEIHAKALLQSQLGALYEVERNVEREAAGEDHERRSRLGACLSRGDAKDVSPGDPGEGGGEKPQQQKPNRAEDRETAGDGSADAVEVVLAEGIGDSVEHSVPDAEIGEVGHGKHGADGHPKTEALIAEVMNGKRDGDERG